jgi:nucleoside-diphosphate-sugar epimerase
MRRVLLTGGGGFIGANLVRRLLADGCEVSLLVRPNFQDWRLADLRGSLNLLAVDLTDRAAVGRAVSGVRPSWIFHLAAYGNSSWHQDLDTMLAVNVRATQNMLEAAAAAGVERLVYTGSSSEYGFKDHPSREDERVEPASFYAVTKAAATHLCTMAAGSGVHVTTLRLFNVYGPYEAPRRLITALALAGLEGALPPLVNPDVARDLVYVGDVAEALRVAAQAPVKSGGVYNVGTGRMLRLREIVETARAVMGITREPVWGSMPDRVWDTSTWVADPTLAQRELGWVAQTPFAEGLQRTVSWFRERPVMQAYYRKAAAAGGASG